MGEIYRLEAKEVPPARGKISLWRAGTLLDCIIRRTLRRAVDLAVPEPEQLYRRSEQVLYWEKSPFPTGRKTMLNSISQRR